MGQKQMIERRGSKRKLEYYQGDERVRDKETLEYINSLVIPPAWKNVQIAVNRSSHILATGYDKEGRLQYIYHPSFRAKQEQAKFERILRFARALPKMRRKVNEHLQRREYDREKVMACIVRLMDDVYFRVGNDTYARDNESYGLTTMRSRHIQVKGDIITFDFVGKSKQRWFVNIKDKKISKIVKKLDSLPGYEIFKYYDEDGKIRDVKSDDVNAYIKEIMGDEFTAKDFRTWGGTLLATKELAKCEWDKSESKRKKIVAGCVKQVAKHLGNTPAVARGSYIDPRVIQAYMTKDTMHKLHDTVAKMQKTANLSRDEHYVLALLEKSSA